MSRIMLVITGIFLLTVPAAVFAAAPAWVTTYGVDVPYPVATHYTGFAIVARSGDEGAALEEARGRAAAALSAQVRVSVTAELSLNDTGTGETSSTEYNSRIRTSSRLEIPGLQFLVEKDRKNLYVLAWVSKKNLAAHWEREAMSKLAALDAAVRTLDDIGEAIPRYEACARTLPLFGDFFDTVTLYTAVGGSAETLFGSVASFSSLAEVAAAEQKVTGTLNRLRKEEILTIDQAFYFMTEQLVLQGISGDSFRITPLAYRETDFSSPFGRFCATRLENTFARRLSGGMEPILFTGYYIDYPSAAKMELGVTARDSKGHILGSARISVPLGTLPTDLSYVPSNLNQALSDTETIREQTTRPGAIHVEAWTAQGGSGDNLVYQEGDAIQFLFRVNRPAYLRLTYVLATGEKVLMEDKFYIGMDQVNTVVEYPVLITPAPPFGVERLIVTAYGTEPPPAEVSPRKIAGQWYDAFTDLDAVYSATRGFQKVTGASRVPETGETTLSLTMTQRIE